MEKQEKPGLKTNTLAILNGRGERIRTSDLFVPNEAR